MSGRTAPGPTVAPAASLDDVAWGPGGLAPVVAQDVTSGDVLMVAYADRSAVDRTLETGEAHFFSRSRGEAWHKGATSGNVLRVVEVRLDCDADVLLYRVRPARPACHTGERSCFFTVVGAGRRALTDPDGPVGIGGVAGLLQRIVAERLERLPEGSYVTRLAGRGVGYVGQKVIEEAGETVVAAVQDDDGFVGEAADLLFHLTVLLALRGATLDDVAQELARRHRDAPAPDAAAPDAAAPDAPARDPAGDGTAGA